MNSVAMVMVCLLDAIVVRQLWHMNGTTGRGGRTLLLGLVRPAPLGDDLVASEAMVASWGWAVLTN